MKKNTGINTKMLSFRDYYKYYQNIIKNTIKTTKKGCHNKSKIITENFSKKKKTKTRKYGRQQYKNMSEEGK